jgi:tRNA(Ile2) C34 agmatinyltransferase TiaS
MTSALLESPPISLFAEARRADAAGGRGITLEQRLERTLRAVQSEGKAQCPVCHASMRLEGHAGRCTGCGSTLA